MRQQLLIFVLLAAFSAACKQQAAPYDRLCKLYAEYESVPDDDAMAMMALSQRVEREIPEIMPFYGLLVQNGRDVRYGVLVDYARNVEKAPADWQCERLRKRWPPSQ